MLRPFPKKYHDNGGAARENACCLCGKAVKPPIRFSAEVVDGGAEFVHTHDDSHHLFFKRADQASYMGWFPVGPDCAKKLRRDKVLVHEANL